MLKALSKEDMIVDCAGQFRPPTCQDPGGFMRKDECWKYHLLCANLGLKVHFVPVKADPSSNSNPSDEAFI